jgi:hypothetical protein
MRPDEVAEYSHLEKARLSSSVNFYRSVILEEREMGVAKPIVIGDLEFAKKGDAVEHFKAMLNRYSPGDKVCDADGRVLAILLARHPEAKAKIGSGIVHFNVRSADFGTQCFWVTRSDGSTEKFAFRSCL